MQIRIFRADVGRGAVMAKNCDKVGDANRWVRAGWMTTKECVCIPLTICF